MRSPTSRSLLALILLVYLVLGILFAVYTPPWQAPDEPAHYNYVRYVAEKGQFPVLHMGDYPHAYLEQIKAARFPGDMSIEPIRYEFHQPPLYYALLAPIYRLTEGRLIPLRLVSVLVGAGIVLFAYAIGRRVWPENGRPPIWMRGFSRFAAQRKKPSEGSSPADIFSPRGAASDRGIWPEDTLLRRGHLSRAEPRRTAEAVIPKVSVPHGSAGSVEVWTPSSTLALAAAAFVAFLPQHLATVSQVGNDVLAELLLAAVLYVLCWRVTEGRLQIEEGRWQTRFSIFNPQSLVVLGFLLGLVLITKTTAYIAVPLAAGVLIWWWRRERADLRAVLAQGAAVFVPAAVLALPWYARNISIYGWPDFLGLQRHDAIVAGQLRAADFIAQNGWPAYWQRAAEWTFKSFWGVFGWMGVWLDSRVYFALALLSGLAMAGLGLRIVNCGSGVEERRLKIGEGGGRIVLVVSALFTLLAYAWYNTQFLQHQGRYLFTALIPIALAFAAGWDGVARPGVGRWLAGGLVVLAIGLVMWGVAGGAGLPKWPVAMTMAAAVGLFLLDLALTLLARYEKNGHPAAGRAFGVLRAAALAFPYVFLGIVALYALFGAIVPQLS